ncbi:hypothetical protein ITX49_17135 [Enterococcus casseliflavus]|uniref:hypothetical protein n=1 Tax=Enterococcus TaxID=1350 RepID=UPI001A1944E7|nr:hypothetical protein [Enterococcus casseliflavus]MBJ0457534.1 hypothetical protein [Enterococcus faecium]MBZ3642904.1 hypothetical protein [Enterococcus casseliflavus]MDT2975031.1 hypothetical protein [Enterococcus casseliflavus]UBL09942.1 hypothetical protein [Enterococcus casseliflavus]
MTDHEKIVKLLNEKFSAMDFTKTERLEDGIWHLVDKTGEMFVQFDGNTAEIRSIVNSIEYTKNLEL